MSIDSNDFCIVISHLCYYLFRFTTYLTRGMSLTSYREEKS